MFTFLVFATLTVGLLVLLANLWSRPGTRRGRSLLRTPSGLWFALTAGEPAAPSRPGPAGSDRGRDDAPAGLRPDSEWRDLLTPEQYRVTREGATERPFSGAWWDHREDGAYHCVCCGQALFDSADKFESDTGWPAFSAPAAPDALVELKAISYGTVRTAARCRRCVSHLGHVFGDGPAPARLRYCINSAALVFVPRAGAEQVQRRAE